MASAELLEIHRQITNGDIPTDCLVPSLECNPLTYPRSGRRPNSLSVVDGFYGDSGKGAVILLFNNRLAKKGEVVSIRFNGGSNTGHEAEMDGKVVVTHQAPMGVVQEGATAVVSNGVVVHPVDLLDELGSIRGLFGGDLPGQLVIDAEAIVCLDTHRAAELIDNRYFEGGRGSTGSGNSRANADRLFRRALTMGDLMDCDWKEKFLGHYNFYEKELAGFDEKLADIVVKTLVDGVKQERRLGTADEFIEELAQAREVLRPHVSFGVYELLKRAWNNPRVAVTLEGAQGPGLDPRYGVYPDITASRPLTRFIGDGTFGIIQPEEIALKAAVMKTDYLSSVGIRELPDFDDERWVRFRRWIQGEFGEVGKSTGRVRKAHAVSLPMGRAFQRADGFEYLIATHIDSSREQMPDNPQEDVAIHVITHYVDRQTGQETDYKPSQAALNRLEARGVTFPGWDGEAAKNAQNPEQLPLNAVKLLAFISRSLNTQVVLGKTGKALENHISWLPDF